MKTLPLNFSAAKILVVGDVMLDHYWHGNAGRISPEAPVPVVKFAKEDWRAGGAANVAMNLAALGAQVKLLGITGRDKAADQLQQMLEKSGVAVQWVQSNNQPTITKLRILSHHQQLLRVDFEESFANDMGDQLLQHYQAWLTDVDVVVFSDYAKGTLANIQNLIQLAKSAGKTTLVDPKGNDFSIYGGVSWIKPNRSELAVVLGDVSSQENIIAKAPAMLQNLGIANLLVTLSEAGMLLVQADGKHAHWGAHATEVFDVTGAGDTVMATLAAALGAGASIKQAVDWSNRAASVVVQKVGTSLVTPEEIQATFHHKPSCSGVVDDWQRLGQCIAMAQSQGESVVLTNGCFDILHPGHLRYLAEAKALGDRLVVAVNSDASVSRLKGPSRPVNGLQDRMEMLAALEVVDWVVSFSEDTPENLICTLKPNLLVKGGDYKPEEVAGGKCVRANGGEVKILSFHQGHSTTNLIKKINKE